MYGPVSRTLEDAAKVSSDEIASALTDDGYLDRSSNSFKPLVNEKITQAVTQAGTYGRNMGYPISNPNTGIVHFAEDSNGELKADTITWNVTYEDGTTGQVIYDLSAKSDNAWHTVGGPVSESVSSSSDSDNLSSKDNTSTYTKWVQDHPSASHADVYQYLESLDDSELDKAVAEMKEQVDRSGFLKEKFDDPKRALDVYLEKIKKERRKRRTHDLSSEGLREESKNLPRAKAPSKQKIQEIKNKAKGKWQTT